MTILCQIGDIKARGESVDSKKTGKMRIKESVRVWTKGGWIYKK